jgi:CheY-like chemotaxis protein
VLLTQLMEAIGLETRVAENGERCVQIFQEWRPDLIWMDRRMPVMDGMEATRRIRQLPHGDAVKIVAVTASAFKEQQSEMLAAGMDDFVRKPYRFDEIYDSLARQLGLEYVYRSDASLAQEAPVIPTSEMALALPLSLRRELIDALERLDSEKIRLLIEQVAAIDDDLAAALSRLANGFNYSAILRILNDVGS